MTVTMEIMNEFNPLNNICLFLRTPNSTWSRVSGLLVVVDVYSYSFDVQNPIGFC